MSEDQEHSISVPDLLASKGKELGVSPWMSIGQDRIDAFAEVTEDRQFIHIDVQRARAETPFGGTIAHGFLTLSLLVPMASSAVPHIIGRRMGINYGIERLRFLAPVPAGARVRGRFTLEDWQERRPGEYLLSYGVSIEIEGQDKPALVATWLTLALV